MHAPIPQNNRNKRQQILTTIILNPQLHLEPNGSKRLIPHKVLPIHNAPENKESELGGEIPDFCGGCVAVLAEDWLGCGIEEGVAGLGGWAVAEEG